MSANRYFRRVGDLLAGLEASDDAGRALDLDAACDAATRLILDARIAGRKGILVGNGGSAAIAGHVQMDLCNRVGVRAQVFYDAPVVTALANDHGYETSFERLVSLWAEPGDFLLAISSSGASPNVLGSVRAGRAIGCRVLTFSGFRPDNPLRALGDYNFYVASDAYGEVEVAHHALGHFLTDHAAATLARERRD